MGERLTREMVLSAFAAYEKHLRQQALREVRDEIRKDRDHVVPSFPRDSLVSEGYIRVLAMFDAGGRFEVGEE